MVTEHIYSLLSLPSSHWNVEKCLNNNNIYNNNNNNDDDVYQLWKGSGIRGPSILRYFIRQKQVELIDNGIYSEEPTVQDTSATNSDSMNTKIKESHS